MEHAKAYLDAIQNPTNPFHDAVEEKKERRLARDKSWIDQAAYTNHVCGIIELSQKGLVWLRTLTSRSTRTV